MPTWISDEKGIWHPAKERVSLKNNTDKAFKITNIDDEGKKYVKTIHPGEDYIYEGPDRGSLFQWWEENGKPDANTMKSLEGNVTMGSNFRENDEFIKQYGIARQNLGFATMDEYLTYLGYDSKKLHDRFVQKASVVTKHDMPVRIAEAKQLGGGQDYATGKLNRYGGFGDAPNV